MSDDPMRGAPGPHPDLDQLALLVPATDGQPETGPADAAVRPHVAGCPECSQRLAALVAATGAVRAELAELPQPAMPPDVAERVGVALATAAGNVLPLADRRRRRFGAGAVASAAAVAAAVALVGGLLAGNLASEDDDPAGGTVAGGAPVGPGALPTVTTSGHNYRESGLEADVAALLKGDFARLSQPEPAGGTGTNAETYDQERAEGRQDSSDPPPRTQKGAARPGTRTDALAARTTLRDDPAALARCLLGLDLDPGTRATAVDLALFKGQPAALIVVPRPAPSQAVEVFVVEPDCPPGEVLSYHRFEVPPR